MRIRIHKVNCLSVITNNKYGYTSKGIHAHIGYSINKSVEIQVSKHCSKKWINQKKDHMSKYQRLQCKLRAAYLAKLKSCLM